MNLEDVAAWATEVFGERAYVRGAEDPYEVEVLVNQSSGKLHVPRGSTMEVRDERPERGASITSETARWDSIIASGYSATSWEEACADAERFFIEHERQTAVKMLGLPKPRFRFVSQEDAVAIRAFMALEGVPADTRPAQVVLLGTWTFEMAEPEPDE